ncbi:MAG TPA: HK97-gp10 family putative phage morphogenesis protein [Acidimicrobiia bacterium]
MSSIEFKIDAEDVIRKLEKLGSLKAAEILAASAFQAGELVAEEMSRRAPDSGESRSSDRKKKNGKTYAFKLKEDIKVKNAKVDRRGVLVRTVVLPYYAQFVERGTSKQPPQPFIKKSAQSVKPQAVAKFQEGVKNMVEGSFR